jgi:predicted dehydrogenase
MNTKEKLRVGVLGCGGFSASFVQLFKEHPYVEKVVVADLEISRAKAFGEKLGVEYYRTLDELLETDVNCIAIFTPRHTHGPLVIQSLKAGRHVYSAVPMASEISHCEEIVKLVKETHLTYMMGETCVYYPCSMFCKEKYQSGDMGKFVYAEAQYHHDIAHFGVHHKSEEAYLGVPPFYYPTHSISMVLEATGSYVTKVTAMGYEDTEDDPYFKKEINFWGNTCSNAFSLMRLANGGVIRINECRRIGWKAPSSSVSAFYGTKAGYQFSNAQHIYVKHTEEGVELEDVSDYVNPEAMTAAKADPEFKNKVANHVWQWNDFAPIQDNDKKRLPEEYKGLPNGHMASHQFLIDDFCTAAYNNTLPTVNAWQAARFTVPGIVAYESLKQEGTPMDVPDFGDAPVDW